MINVYRGITGTYRPGMGPASTYTGVSVEQLQRYGIACNNGSPAQNSLFESLEPAFRRVPGLPVSLDRQSALDWINRKAYRSPEGRQQGLAVLGEVAVAEELIADGTVEIWRNNLSFWNPDERRLTLEELEAHRDGVAPIGSECFIPRYQPDLMRDATTFWVPRAHTLDGGIDMSLDPTLMDLAELGPFPEPEPDPWYV